MTAPSPEAVAFHSQPPPVDGWSMRTERYADGLDVYVYAPDDPGGVRRPGIVFFHGGGWRNGHPLSHMRHINRMAALGWVAATAQYRLVPQATYPAQVDDARAALRWLRARDDVDASRVAVAGGSAGAHLAAMLAVEADAALRAAVLWYPPVDLRTAGARPELSVPVNAYLAGASAEEASPLLRVHAEMPPVLTMTGDADEAVPVETLRAFHRALDEAGVANRLEVFPGRKHAFDFDPADWQPCFDLMAGFLAEHAG